MARTELRSRPEALKEELQGLDTLELAAPPRRRLLVRLWSGAWPKLLAVGIAIFAWQAVVWAHWRPEYVLPSPPTVFETLFDDFGDIWSAALITLKRGLAGFALALLIGTVLGALVARIGVLRAALGSMITGLQTMPSIAWFPLAILLFKLTEGAILFVVVLGAAPSIANGLISGIDHVPPVLLRAGRVLGARGLTSLRHVILPAALPSFVGGLKQGWAFAWRSLLAGELLVVIPGQVSLGQRLQFAREFSDAAGLIAVMIVILVIGIVVDALVFGAADRTIRRRYGLIEEATA
jgi:NitT/TauT family transport system permease protein